MSFLSIIFVELHLFMQSKSLSRELKKCLRTTLRCLTGRMRPAGRTLPRPEMNLDAQQSKSSNTNYILNKLVRIVVEFSTYTIQ